MTRSILALADVIAAGDRSATLNLVAECPAPRRQAFCRPVVPQAKLISGAEHGTTSAARSRASGNPDEADAWRGRLGDGHADAATVVMLGAKAAPQAAKLWPLPLDWGFAEKLIPALFPNDLEVFVAQWSADYLANPKHVDRNVGRAVMYEWIERGLVAPPAHDGAVLMLISGWVGQPGKPLLRWLLAHPKVTAHLFTRIFTTVGVKGASLAQADEAFAGTLRSNVVPGLITAGVWKTQFVAEETRKALGMDLPPYQRRWFLKLADDLGM